MQLYSNKNHILGALLLALELLAVVLLGFAIPDGFPILEGALRPDGFASLMISDELQGIIKSVL